MPVRKTENKGKSSVITLVLGLAFTLIPLGIIALISIKNKNVWDNPYSYYVYAMIGLHLYFSIVIGLIAWRSKRLYTICEFITVLLTVVAVILSYVFGSFKGGVLLHIGAGFLVTYSLYKLGDTTDKDNVRIRYFPSLILTIFGLVTSLWFISVKFSIVAHTVIATISNVIFGITSIVLFIKFFKTNAIDSIEESEFSYEEETEEEIDARRAAKRQAKGEEKYEALGGKEVVVGEGEKYIIDPWSIDWLIKGLDKYYDEYVEAVNDIYHEGWEAAEYDYDNATTKEEVDRANGIMKDLNKFLKKMKRTIDFERKEHVKFVKKLATKVFTKEDCGYYYEYHLHTCWTKKRKIIHQDRFKVAMTGIICTVRFKAGLFETKRSREITFDKDYISLYFNEISKN